MLFRIRLILCGRVGKQADILHEFGIVGDFDAIAQGKSEPSADVVVVVIGGHDPHLGGTARLAEIELDPLFLIGIFRDAAVIPVLRLQLCSRAVFLLQLGDAAIQT